MSELESVGQGEGAPLVDLVNRVMDRGVVVTGEVVISVADVDLVYMNLSLLLSSVETIRGSDHPEKEGR